MLKPQFVVPLNNQQYTNLKEPSALVIDKSMVFITFPGNISGMMAKKGPIRHAVPVSISSTND